MTDMTSKTKPDCVCAIEELVDKTILPDRWVMVYRNIDGHDGIGIKILGGRDVLADLLRAEARLAEVEKHRDEYARLWHRDAKRLAEAETRAERMRRAIYSCEMDPNGLMAFLTVEDIDWIVALAPDAPKEMT